MLIRIRWFYMPINLYYFSSADLNRGCCRLLDADKFFQSITLLLPGGAVVTKISICFPWKGSMTSLPTKLCRKPW